MLAYFRQLLGKRTPPHPARFYYVPGPVFTEPAMAAIYVTELAKPAQRILGGGYPVAMQFRSVQNPQLFARPAVTVDGIGIQQGQYALTPLTNDDGTWPQQSGTEDNGGAVFIVD